MKRIFVCCLLSAVAGGIAAAYLLNNDSPVHISTAFAEGPALRTAPPVTLANPPYADPETLLTPEEQTHIHVYELSNRSVVNVNTRFESHDRFFPMLSAQGEGSGSGSVIDKNGHILTNYHVVEDAEEIQVMLFGGKAYPANLVGYDAGHDIAILKVDAPADVLFPITFGTSQNLKVGQRVYALGNPFGLEGTMTTGIISNLNRTLPSRVEGHDMQSIIQTDAALNPGNSGGPLLDTSGRLIGMNVAIATKSGQNAGLGFAIPVSRIARFIPELIANGKITRPDLGIVTVNETDKGLQIVRLNPGGPAERAGLRGWGRREVKRGPLVMTTNDSSKADYIVAIDGQPVVKGDTLIEKIEEHKPGDTVMLSVLREGQPTQVSVTLGSDT
ncbi:MAG TPA: trypsin-like peptidase domain-containing protein [Lacipirellulaceae bacterium]|jgi:S1-C subfamily serine protease